AAGAQGDLDLFRLAANHTLPSEESQMSKLLSDQSRLSPSPARRFVRTALISLLPLALAGIGSPADARITQIQINSRALAFGGASFGSVGQYETLRGVALGVVEYNMDFWINKPVDMTRANGTLLHDIPNRGSVRSLELNVGGAGDSN